MSEVSDVKQIDMTVNSFTKMIKAGMIKRTDRGMQIQLKNIHDKLREDGSCWNRRNMKSARTMASIERIFEHLNRGGIVPAIEVQPKEGGGVVKIDGYCRVEAWKKMDASGEGDLWVYIVPFEGDDLQALERIQSSNMDEKLSPLDQLDLYLSARAELRAAGEKGTLQQIADVYHCSRQYVDQILKLESLDEEGRNLLEAGKINVKQAIAAIRKGKDTATEQLKKDAKANADKDKPKPPTVSKELFVDMYGHVTSIRKSLPIESARAAEEFLRGERAATDMVAIEVGELAKLMALLGEGDRQLEAKALKAKAKDEESRQEKMADDDLKQDLDDEPDLGGDEPGFFDDGGGHQETLDASKLPQQSERDNDEPDLSFL